MRCGYFDDKNREYRITDARTPVKWINYIGSLEFGGFVDHTGGALICRRDPALNRITKYISQMPASDFKGETLYVRIHETQGQTLFSPFFVPGLDALEHFETRVGLGYTHLSSRFQGVQTDVTIFVPLDAPVEIRDMHLTNLRSTPLQVDLIPVVEYTHPDALKQLTNADWVPQTMTSRAEAVDGLRVLVQYPFMTRDFQINYFTASQEASSFETDRKAFLGANEYGTWAHPLSLDASELGCHAALRGDNIAALMLPQKALAPGESARVITLLGQASSLDAAAGTIRRFRDPACVDAAFAALRQNWDQTLSALQVTTPDEDFNRMVNIFNPRQCRTTFEWSRYLSYYQLGYGARGIGFRDSSQDCMGVLANIPEAAKALLIRLLSVQKRDGSAMHQFNPLTMMASAGDALERDDRPHYYSDDALWAVLAVTEYLKESGDRAFLEMQIPFYEKDRQETPLETGTVLEHLERALAFTRQNTGAHGLPLLGFADWNDTVNLPSGAESLFTAFLFGRAALAMIELYEASGAAAKAAEVRQAYAQMRQNVCASAWDGDWFVRYFDADGTPLGSHTNAHGKIYINAQTWALLSGFATEEQGRSAMDAVNLWLNTPNGIKLSAPGFNQYDPQVGGITTYPPGAKENGGIFLHTNPWAIIAESLLGRGDRAFQYYQQINPAARNERIETYECEPYVYPQNILGDEHPQFGLARNSWLSGTASWVYQAATQYILGIRAGYAGLTIDPCIPRNWNALAVTRRFRGAEYQIQVYNPQQVCRGVIRMQVDGVEISPAAVPLAEPGKKVRVEVWLGES